MSDPVPNFCAFPLADYLASKTEIMAATQAVMERGQYILGESVAAFEGEFAAFCGTAYAMGVANGTDAVEILLLGLGIGAGDWVAVPSFTAVASVSGIRRTGAKPLFVDINRETFTMDPRSLEAALATNAGSRVRAVLAVHLYGHPADMQVLASICDVHGVILLEDCAQAHGACLGDRRAGSLAKGAAFSFYPTKNLGAMGDGGAITTDDPDLIMRLREIRQYGWRDRYISVQEGINSRLDEIQAAILRLKLKRLTASNLRRSHLAERYRRGLEKLPAVTLPITRTGCSHAYHLYVIRTPYRDELMDFLMAQQIPVSRHYPAAVHQQPGYAGYFRHSPQLPETERAIREVLSLPLHPYLKEETVDCVVQAIHRWHGHGEEKLPVPSIAASS